jgi:hypothetical protein
VVWNANYKQSIWLQHSSHLNNGRAVISHMLKDFYRNQGIEGRIREWQAIHRRLEKIATTVGPPRNGERVSGNVKARTEEAATAEHLNHITDAATDVQHSRVSAEALEGVGDGVASRNHAHVEFVLLEVPFCKVGVIEDRCRLISIP